MNQELFVPLFEWLVGGSRIGGGYNRYYGSQTERPAEAAWGQRVFNYAVYIEKIREDDKEQCCRKYCKKHRNQKTENYPFVQSLKF